MKKIRFIQIQKDNPQHYKILKDLMFPYNRELDADKPDEEPASEDSILKFTQGCINMQGAYDRHLELAFVGDDPIGFLYGKVDHEEHKGHNKPGYGYIMEFYIKPEHRRNGYGRILFRRLEQHFSGHGAKRMYLNTRASGEAFWRSMGFSPTNEIQPHNNMAIWEKDVRGHDAVAISVSEYLTHELAEKIAFFQWRGNTPKDFNHIRQFFVYDGKYSSDCFNVIAINSSDDVVGRLFCLKNQENPKRWYHGDLAVAPEYRRMKIASKMIQTAIQKISDMGGEIIDGYTAKTHTASINLNKSLGFIEKPCVQFDNLIHGEEQIMLERRIAREYNVIPATAEEAVFIFKFYTQNRETLHGSFISLKDWKEAAFWNDPDEQNFLVCRGAMPVAWMRVNGLDNPNNQIMAWISMLVVSDKWQRQGAGTYAVNYAEEYVIARGFTKMGIKTTGDNIAAKALYEKCGYIVTEYKDGTYPDGTTGKGYTFEKSL
ncbi:MAG: GNAT family N-acetyltransferase [Oscillospiraceae bacterium]|nr:GNAT family N-acetyltransferase [Oscillospiraceae bacterium]